MIEPLGRGDEVEVEAFLAARADTTMFLRSNLRAAGFAWTPPSGRAFEGHWVAARADDGRLVGVAYHAWNGNLLIEADAVDAPGLARAVIARSGRTVAGFVGAPAAARAARTSLGLDDAPADLDSLETLMSLALDRLVVPPALARGDVIARRARVDDHATIIPWRAAYHVEILGRTDDDATRAAARVEIERGTAHGTLWVLEDAATHALLAKTAFNATLPDIVQIGGVYTPPALRRRGHAQAVVAGSLLAARADGVSRAVLFTDGDNPATMGAYGRIGFTAIGAFMLVLLRAPRT